MQQAMKLPAGATPLLFVALTALGAAGNYFSFPVFFSIDFLFGSVFSMLALQLLGGRLGVASALVAGSVTLAAWNHPYAIVVFVAEALVVALLTRRRVDLVKADAIYWCVLGVPLVFLFYYYVMQLPLSNVTTTMLKQALNGIWNALVARIVFIGIAHRMRQGTFSMRELTFNFPMLLVMLVVLVAIGINSRRERSALDLGVRTALQLSGSRTAVNLDEWLQSRMRSIGFLARRAAGRPRADMQGALERLLEESSDFLQVGLVDRDATIIARPERMDPPGQPGIGTSLGDPSDVRRLLQTLAPMLGQVMPSRAGEPGPIVPVLAPVVAPGGGYAGYAIGLLKLDGMERLVALNSETGLAAGATYALLDPAGRVIFSSDAKLKTLQPFARDRGELIHLGGGLMQWRPEAQPGTSVSERWKTAVYVHESGIGGTSGWKLVLQLPVQPFALNLYADFTRKLSYLAIILLFTYLLAELLSRKMAASLEELKDLSADLPRRVEAGEEIDWGRSAIEEVRLLQDNFSATARTLARKFEEGRRFNEVLEDRVAQRTEALHQHQAELEMQNEELRRAQAELRTAQALYYDLYDLAPVGYLNVSAKGLILQANLTATNLLGVARGLPEQNSRYV